MISETDRSKFKELLDVGITIFPPSVLDEYKTLINTAESALLVRQVVDARGSCAVALGLNNATMFHISVVDLARAVPVNMDFEDGSNRGCQFNIDRLASYALSWNNPVTEDSYITDHWHAPMSDALALLPFFNTILTYEDYYAKLQDEEWYRLATQQVGLKFQA